MRVLSLADSLDGWPRSAANSYTGNYDAWNRLVKLSDASGDVQTNEFDGLHRRIRRTEGGATTGFYYNEQWQCVLESDIDGSTETPEVMYMWHPHYIDALAVTYDSSGTKHFYLHDANFNVTGVLNSSGAVVERYSYTPYGEVTHLNADFSKKTTQSSSIDNEHLYTGRRTDPETGLQLNRRRFYHQQLGRWVNRDPIGYEGGMNLYEYTGSLPVSHLDPMGTDWWSEHRDGYEKCLSDGRKKCFKSSDLILEKHRKCMDKVYCECKKDFPYCSVEFGKEPVRNKKREVTGISVEMLGCRWIQPPPSNFGMWLPIVGGKPNPASWLGSVKCDVEWDVGAPPAGLNLKAATITYRMPCKCIWTIETRFEREKLNMCTGNWDDIGSFKKNSTMTNYGKVVHDPVGGKICNCLAP